MNITGAYDTIAVIYGAIIVLLILGIVIYEAIRFTLSFIDDLHDDFRLSPFSAKRPLLIFLFVFSIIWPVGFVVGAWCGIALLLRYQRRMKRKLDALEVRLDGPRNGLPVRVGMAIQRGGARDRAGSELRGGGRDDADAPRYEAHLTGGR